MANVPQILCILIDLFFPDGASPRGQSAEMNFYVAFSKCEVICEDNFSLGDYSSVNKLSKPQRNPYDQKNHSGTDDLKPDQSALIQNKRIGWYKIAVKKMEMN